MHTEGDTWYQARIANVSEATRGICPAIPGTRLLKDERMRLVHMGEWLPFLLRCPPGLCSTYGPLPTALALRYE